jgi:hypothetical protein
MKLPEKLLRYENLKSLGFMVKPCYYSPIGDSRDFIANSSFLLEEFPILMLRSAVDESGLTYADSLNLPRRYNLRTEEDISRAYFEMKGLLKNYANPWVMAWHFYPRKELLSMNLVFSAEKVASVEVSYNVGHEDQTQGLTTPARFSSHFGSLWQADDTGFPTTYIYGYDDGSYSQPIPKGILFEAFSSLRQYFTLEDQVAKLMGNSRRLVLETITQLPIPESPRKKHFALDYVIESP